MPPRQGPMGTRAEGPHAPFRRLSHAVGGPPNRFRRNAAPCHCPRRIDLFGRECCAAPFQTGAFKMPQSSAAKRCRIGPYLGPMGPCCPRAPQGRPGAPCAPQGGPWGSLGSPEDWDVVWRGELVILLRNPQKNARLEILDVHPEKWSKKKSTPGQTRTTAVTGAIAPSFFSKSAES